MIIMAYGILLKVETKIIEIIYFRYCRYVQKYIKLSIIQDNNYKMII